MGEIRGTLTLGNRSAAVSTRLAAQGLVKRPEPAPQSGRPAMQSGPGRASESFVRVGGPSHLRVLPKFQPRPRDFRAAVEDAKFLPISPAFLPVPEQLLGAIRAAKSVLVIAHTSPDIDCVGSALSLGAVMKIAGKQCDICIDDDLGAAGSKLDKRDWINKAHALADKSWDLAIVVDTASDRRIGKGKQLLARAAAVAVVDHHESEKGDLCDQFPSQMHFVNARLDAAALQVTAIAERLFEGKTLDKAQLRAIHGPALAGMTTDTKWGSLASISEMTPHAFKHGLAVTGLTLDAVAESYEVKMPQYLRELASDNRIFEQVIRPNIKIVKVTADQYKALGREVRKHVKGASDREVTNLLRERIDFWAKHGDGAAALVVDLSPGIMVSLRSSNGAAHRLASQLGGGGHGDAASARVRGKSLDQVVNELVRLV